MTPEEERLFNAIETVVDRLYPRHPSSSQMEAIRQRFPCPLCMIEAGADAIAMTGLGWQDGFYFSMIPALSRRTHQEAFGPHPRLDHLSVMSAYLKTLFTGIHVECYYAVLLSASGLLIRPVLIDRGVENATLFDLKQTLAVILKYSARAVVLCHNHPSGTLEPSQEDIRCTLQAINATVALNIPMLDHIIIAHDQAVSLRDSGAIPSRLWIMQAPDSRLLRNWIDVDALPKNP